MCVGVCCLRVHAGWCTRCLFRWNFSNCKYFLCYTRLSLMYTLASGDKKRGRPRSRADFPKSPMTSEEEIEFEIPTPSSKHKRIPKAPPAFSPPNPTHSRQLNPQAVPSYPAMPTARPPQCQSAGQQPQSSSGPSRQDFGAVRAEAGLSSPTANYSRQTVDQLIEAVSSINRRLDGFFEKHSLPENPSKPGATTSNVTTIHNALNFHLIIRINLLTVKVQARKITLNG